MGPQYRGEKRCVDWQKHTTFFLCMARLGLPGVFGSSTVVSLPCMILRSNLAERRSRFRPDLRSTAVAHLCEECNAKRLVYDPFCQKLAQSAQAACNHTLNTYSLPTPAAFQNPDPNHGSPVEPFVWPVTELDVAYYHHTSGTSGGLPKLLPVTHRMAIAVLPHQTSNPCVEATFSTTPIYHGGVADCFRSWSASAMIWLYPGEIAMTAKVLQSCIAGAQTAHQNDLGPPLAYISCVPVVLNQFAEISKGIEILKSMRMVGFGGAAMPEQLANRLVDEGVNLLSRYGMTECGFLLSSYRSFDTDKDWQYLRHNPRVTAIRFEPQEDNLFELVVDASWPALSKASRPDGSFATKDLFEPHASMPNAWKHHSRADAQLALNTGKKFDPTPSEDSIRQSDLLDDILIFGDNHSFPGALLFRSKLAASLDSDEIVHQVWPLVDENNAHCPKHAKIHRSMLVVMPPSSSALPKSSKGTTLRRQAVDFYRTCIEDAYATGRFQQGPLSDGDEGSARLNVDDDQVMAVISEIVKNSKEGLDGISIEDDFYNHGVDSSDCIRIREQIQAKLIPPHCPKLPLDVVYDNGNITNLSDFVIKFRRGITSSREDELQLMRDLVAQYSNWQIQETDNCLDHCTRNPEHVPSGKGVALITGVTGTLGAHLLSQLSTQPSVGEIHCLIRGASTTAASERARKSLIHRQLPSLDGSAASIHYHPCNLSQTNLGLDEEVYEDLAQRVTLIIHAAWTVNFTTRLPSFVKDNIVGLHNLIQFTLTSRRSTPPHFVFCSSTASAIGSDDQTNVPESILDDPRRSSPIGYSRSKWVAEQICNQAHRETYLHNHISVLRIGQLCGDTKHGVWNIKEGWPLMLSSSQVTSCLPNLGHEPLSWLPVDMAARASLEIAASVGTGRPIQEGGGPCEGRASEQMIHPCRVYNIVNPSTSKTWADLLRWMQKACPRLEVVSPDEWLARLEGLEGKAANHPSRALLGFWRGIYSDENVGKSSRGISYDMEQTRRLSRVMRNVDAISEEQFSKMWAWIEGEMAAVK